MRINPKTDITTRIRGVGLKVTPTRVMVFRHLVQTPHPQSVKDICKGIGAPLDQVTVYRTLAIFVRARLIQRIDLQAGHALYEVADEVHDHHHIVCLSCKRIEDFEGCDFRRIATNALRLSKDFVRIDTHNLELFGLCKKCVSAT